MISPFIEEILRTKFLEKINRPSIVHYDGITDPKVFLSHFRYAMKNQDLTPMHMCKLFPKYLIGAANEWFSELP